MLIRIVANLFLFLVSLIGLNQGFLLKRSSSDVCGRYLHSRRTAVITSPFFPSNYPNNTDCLWRIRAAKRRVLVITITTLDTEEGYDYLEIKQGRWYTISPFVGRYTGKVNRTMQLTLNSNSAWIRFRSDELINSVGFRLVYRAEQIRCPRIPAPANGMKLHQNRTVGGVVLFKCDDGYRMVGKRRIKCLAIGKWNSESPSCVECDGESKSNGKKRCAARSTSKVSH
ncbi:CUB and sushi domain-containing protein 1-like [Corticium candelabrum]|uniref:CUB and sushi domain-containing protein 1-like n=1 Tax=Corticium candelabrum TaxID=121492 RepID=UPI002E26A1EA|nr:CUB and sushi domain-containing protein 1-like [Corticium candelabrum]